MGKPISVEEMISWSLRIGVYLAGVVIILGLASLIVKGHSGYEAGAFPTSLGEAIRGSLSLKPAAIISMGLILLILTPVFRVAASVVLFFYEKDYLYTLITAVVLTILLAGLVLGTAI